MEHLTRKARTSLDVFDKAWKAFNKQDKKTLGDQLDKNVIVCRLRDGVLQYSGHDAVLTYLTNGLKDKPPGIAGSTFIPNKNDQRASDTKVTGSAAWTDIDGSTDHPTLQYDFDFDPDSGLIVKFFAV